MNAGPWELSDETTLVACYDHTVARVYRYAGRLTANDRTRAGGLVQAVYLELVDAVQAGSVTTVDIDWLVAAVRRTFISSPTDERTRRQLPSSAINVSVHEIQVDRPAAASLPDRERAALVLHHLDHMSVEQIAAELGLSVRAATSLVERADKRAHLPEAGTVSERMVRDLTGDDLDPTTEFVVSLWNRLVGAWRGEVMAAPEPVRSSSSRGWWLVVATGVVVLVVVAAVAWLGSAAPAERPATTSRSLAPTSVPSSALGHVWVVTKVGDVPWSSPNLPSFVFDGAGLLAGSGFGGPSVAGPYTFTSEFDVHTDRITAERFDRSDVQPVDLERTFRFGPAGSFTLAADGTMRVDGRGCEPVVGTYLVTAERLQFELQIPDCAVSDGDFRAWLQAMTDVGGRVAFHVGPAQGMWTEIDGKVTRLTVAPRPLVAHELGGDAAPDAAGLRVAEWSGAELAALGVTLDGAYLGVRIDGSLISLAGDGNVLRVVDDRGKVTGATSLDSGFSRLTVLPGDVAELVGVAGSSLRSVRDLTLGDPAVAAAQVEVNGPTPECEYGVRLGTRRWTVVQPDCATALINPVALDNGSVIALTRATVANDPNTERDDVIELAAIRLNADGTQQRVVLGRHAVGGAEGWITVQATETGAFVVFHYPDDAVVLYRYLFV